MKNIRVEVGSINISVNSGAFNFSTGSYSQQISTSMTDDLKAALINFTALLIETEE